MFADISNYKYQIIFIIYLASIFLFSFVYWLLYRRNQFIFTFNQDISRKRITEKIEQLENNIKERTRNWKFTKEVYKLMSNPNRRFHMVHQKEKFINSGILELSYKLSDGTVVITDRAVDESGFKFYYRILIKRINEIGEIQQSYEFKHSKKYECENKDRLMRSFRYEIKELLKSNSKNRIRLKKIRQNIEGAWNYFDLLYFSFITQTTVGYGDILPNSTIIRVLVCLQIMFSVLLLTVVLNISFK